MDREGGVEELSSMLTMVFIAHLHVPLRSSRPHVSSVYTLLALSNMAAEATVFFHVFLRVAMHVDIIFAALGEAVGLVC